MNRSSGHKRLRQLALDLLAAIALVGLIVAIWAGAVEVQAVLRGIGR